MTTLRKRNPTKIYLGKTQKKLRKIIPRGILGAKPENPLKGILYDLREKLQKKSVGIQECWKI